MPKMRDKLRGVKESAGGFNDIEPGAYKLVITSSSVVPDKQYVRFYWDVADGPFKGAYADSQYPPSDVMSWKESAAGMLKMKLHRLAQCNPRTLHPLTGPDGEFEGLQEFEEDNWGAFTGKYFAAVVRRRIYTAGPNSKNPGADRTAIEVARWLTPEEYKSGDWPKKLLEDRDDRDKTAAQAPAQQQPVQAPADFAPADVYDEDVPF